MTHFLSVVDIVVQKHDELGPPESWAKPGSELAALVDAMPPSPITLLDVLGAAASAACASLEHVRVASQHDMPVPLGLLQNDLRRAILGAARVCLILGPSDPSVRVEWARLALAKDLQSLNKAYKALGAVTHLKGLVPPVDVINESTQAAESLPKRRVGEMEMLDQAAGVIAILLMQEEDVEEDDIGVLRDHVTWVFHAFSGIAHAHAWPWTSVPNSIGAPGDFPGDFGLIAGIGQLAIDLIDRRAQQPA